MRLFQMKRSLHQLKQLLPLSSQNLKPLPIYFQYRNVLKQSYQLPQKQIFNFSQINDNKIEGILDLALDYLGTKRIDQAKLLYKAVISFQPLNCEANIGLGRVYLLQSDFDQALEQFEKVLTINPQNCKAMNEIATLYLLQFKFDEAILQYKKVLLIQPEEVNLIYVNIGNAQFCQGMFGQAKKYYLKVIETDHKNSKAFCKLGQLLSKEGQKEEAKKYLEKAVELDPELMETNFSLGEFFEENEQYDQAQVYYEKAVQIYPYLDRIYPKLGKVHFMLENYHEAVKYLESAVKFYPDDSLSINYLGISYFIVGKQDLSEKCFSQFQSVDPSLNYAKFMSDTLKQFYK